MKRVVLSLCALAVAILACVVVPPTHMPVSDAPKVEQSSIKHLRKTNVPLPSKPILATYTATGTVYIRGGNDGAYLEPGHTVQCQPQDNGWCNLDNGTRVWQGCLDPNPMGLGCRKR